MNVTVQNGLTVTNSKITYSSGEEVTIPNWINRIGCSTAVINGEVYVNGWHYNRKKKKWHMSLRSLYHLWF